VAETSDQTLVIPVAALRRVVAAIFERAGCDAEESTRIAYYLSCASLTGHDSHGVIRTQRYIEWLREGRVKAGQTLKIITESDVMAMVDGQYGFGQTIGPQAVQMGIDKARQQGVSIIALRHSGHLGRIGDWAEMAAAANQVSLHFVNVSGSLLVAPFGGVERRMSTNPIAIGVPLSGSPPIIHDFATSRVAEGKVLVAQKGGKPVPGDSFIGPDGQLSANPLLLYGEVEPGRSPNPRLGPGALRTMGEHKGSGLAFLCEMLAGALTGSGCAGTLHERERPICNGMLSIYLDMDFFDSEHRFAQEARQYIEFFKSSQPAASDGEVLIPGDVERRTRAEREREGLPLPSDAWRSIVAAAHSVGLDDTTIAELRGSV